MPKKSRDVVVVRVSEQGGREDENFRSPKAQLAKAKFWSDAQGNRVVAAFEEIDVSGKLPLDRRPGLLRAIEMVEAGQADHIVVADFDRLVRSPKVQFEVIERVERAGGEIYAIDHGKLANGTAATRMSNNMMGAAFQYFAEVTGEKVTAAQARAVARGVLPNSRIVPGYMRGEDGVLVVERLKARIVVEAFKRRDQGASLVEIQCVAGREWDRALDLRCGVDAALADVPRRDPFRRAAQPERPSAALVDRPETPATRGQGRRPGAHGQALGRVGHPREDATRREEARRAIRGLLQALGRRAESRVPTKRKAGASVTAERA